jgi:hypothetical protein
MAKLRFLGKVPDNSVERLQELRRQADKDGDNATRDKLAALIEAKGGTVPTGDIPENETKLGRLTRLQIEAQDAGDIDSATKLAALIIEEQGVEEEIVAPEPPESDYEPVQMTGSANITDIPDGYEASIADDAEISLGVVGSPELVNPTEPDPIEPVALNNGQASVNVKKKCEDYGYDLAEIPARDGGKVDMIDFKAYRKMLGE